MISVVPGEAVGRFLTCATARPQLYEQITLCAPYIDLAVASRIRELCQAASRSRCSVTVITTCASAELLHGLRVNLHRRVRILVRGRLHTKVYLLLARSRSDCSEALVTSANLTEAGLRTNDELGVLIRGSTPGGRILIQQVDRSLRKLSIQ